MINCKQLGIIGGLVVSGWAILAGDRALAQSSNIVPDNTLGNENSRVVPLDSGGFPVDVIDGGAVRGDNLFHSLQEFNVSEGRGAYFFSPNAAIQNILARVTGSNRSEIMGALGTFGESNPNLFLINPNGIVFGEDASLDVGGAFVATTANAIQFGNQGFFSASNPNTPPILTINPSAFLFSQAGINPIINQAGQSINGLEVGDGKSLLLLGGDVIVDSGRLATSGGRIEVGGLAEPGTVELTVAGEDLRLGFPATSKLANISFTKFSRVGDTGFSLFSSQDGGEIRLWGDRITLKDASFIFSYTSSERDGRGIDIQASQLNLQDGSFIRTNVLSGSGNGGNVRIKAKEVSLQGQAEISATTTLGEGNAGNLSIDADRLTITDVGSLSTTTSSSGRGGDLTVRASEIELSGTTPDGNFSSGIFSRVSSEGQGDGGNLSIESQRLALRDGAKISTEVFGQGRGGNLSVTASESIELIGRSAQGLTPSGLFTRTESQTESAKAGNLNITTGRLTVQDGAQASVSTFGLGDAGDLTVRAAKIELSGTAINEFPSGLFAQANLGTGNGGKLTIDTKSLIIQAGAQVSSATLDEGQAGDLEVIALESVKVTGTSVNGLPSRITTNTNGSGNAGNVIIKTGQMSVQDRGEISAGTFGQGNSGNIEIKATNSVEVTGVNPTELSSGIFTSTFGTGQGGSIKVDTNTFRIVEGGVLDARTIASGSGGSIIINANSFEATNNGQLGATTEGSGRAGNITVNSAESLTLRNGAGLFASTFGKGDAGKVFIQAQDISLARGYIFSTVELGAEGKGGNIDIAAKSIFVNDGSEINASTFGLNDAGSISIKADDSIALANRSGVFTTVQTGAVGNGGNIDIQARSLSLSNGAQIQGIVFRQQGNQFGGRGTGGNIRINATDFVNLAGVSTDGFSSGLLTSTERGAEGKAGDITVDTNALRLADGAVINAQTLNSSDGGNITINAKIVEAVNGGQVLAVTRDAGKAGNITFKIADSIILTGSDSNFLERFSKYGRDIVNNEGAASGIFASTDPNSTGNGGSVFIDPKQLTITDAAGIAVNSQGRGNGGNLRIQAGNVTLDNRAFLSAATGSSEGGNVTLEVGDLLLMRRNSEISAQAGSTGNGGNINLDTRFLVAFPEENNDIIANAFEGEGGNINIRASGVFGIQSRNEFTSLSDINASSEFGIDGVVEINTPDVDLQNSLSELAANFVNPDQVVAGSCLARRNAQRGSFTVTGTGGLPSNPYEAMSGRYALTSVQPIQESENATSTDGRKLGYHL